MPLPNTDLDVAKLLARRIRQKKSENETTQLFMDDILDHSTSAVAFYRAVSLETLYYTQGQPAVIAGLNDFGIEFVCPFAAAHQQGFLLTRPVGYPYDEPFVSNGRVFDLANFRRTIRSLGLKKTVPVFVIDRSIQVGGPARDVARMLKDPELEKKIKRKVIIIGFFFGAAQQAGLRRLIVSGGVPASDISYLIGYHEERPNKKLRVDDFDTLCTTNRRIVHRSALEEIFNRGTPLHPSRHFWAHVLGLGE